jgi:putative peptide zinc metalloprotease protein
MTAGEVTAPSGALSRAEGVQLLGEMAGSGYRVPPALVRRGDGQTLQLTTLLYLTLEAIDGHRDPDAIAEVVRERFGKPVSADNVQTLIDEQLRPLGLLTRPDGSQPEVKRTNPLLGLRMRYAVTDPERTRRITGPFTLLFRWFVVLPMLAAFAYITWWVLFDRGLAQATRDAFNRPGLLLLVVGVTVLSAGFHEFGHAAAARYGGAVPGVMGMGLYLVWPAFYTDVTDSYRLGRAGRVRTDLGGLYFNAIVAVAITGIWWATSYDALLLVVATQILQMIRQLTPLVRFDGYHVLADVTGVPDLFHRIGPTLRGVLPWRWGDPEARLLKRWARAVVTLWVVIVVPLLLFTVAMMVLTLPRMLATAWVKLQAERLQLGAAWADGDLVAAAARVIVIAAVVLPVVGAGLMLARTVKRGGVSVWRRTEGRPVRRTVAALTAAAVVAALGYVWWPDGHTYRPIGPGERGTLADGLQLAGAAARTAPASVPESAPTWKSGDRGTVQAVWDSQQPPPTEAEPQLSLVLVPHEPDSSAPEGWVFPFDRPLAPEPGDNQALAVNTSDGTVTYDAAFALVWVEDGDPALNNNEAYAFASCRSCGAVAVAFQVVLVLGDNHVAAPVNLAGALTSDCVNCLTYALAQQLFVTLDGPLTASAMSELDALWKRIAAYGNRIDEVPLDEVAGQLDQFEQELLAIIDADQPGTVPSPAASSTDTEDSGSASPSPSTPAAASPSASASSSSSPSPSSSDTGSPTPGSSSAPSTPSPSASSTG